MVQISITSSVLRVLTHVLLLISLIVLTNVIEISEYGLIEFRSQDFQSYRYAAAMMAFGIAFTLFELAIPIYNIISSAQGNLLFDFYGDKILSYMLASGVAAEFAVTVDFQNKFESFADFGQFYGKSYASASLLLLAVLFNVVLSVLSSYALPKKESETTG